MKPPVGAKTAKKASATAVSRPAESPAEARSKAVYEAMELLLEHGSESNSALLQCIACLSGDEFLQVIASVMRLPQYFYVVLQKLYI